MLRHRGFFFGGRSSGPLAVQHLGESQPACDVAEGRQDTGWPALDRLFGRKDIENREQFRRYDTEVATRSRLREGLSVEVLDALYERFFVVVRRSLSGPNRHGVSGGARQAEEANDPLGEIVRVSGSEGESAFPVSDELRNAAYPTACHRQAGKQALVGDEWRVLAPHRGQHAEGGAGVEVRDFGSGKSRREADRGS